MARHPERDQHDSIIIGGDQLRDKRAAIDAET